MIKHLKVKTDFYEALQLARDFNIYYYLILIYNFIIYKK